MVSDVAMHVLKASNDWVVKFNPDGTIEINPEYTKEEAARQFVAIACELYSEEHRSLREKLAKAEAALAQEKAEAVRVKVKPLEWREHPYSFPAPTWSAQTPFGFFNIEEVSASDAAAYEVRLHAHHLVSVTESLDLAKAAAQADYERWRMLLRTGG